MAGKLSKEELAAADEDDINELLKRDDDSRTLWELLREEDIKPSDLLRLKRSFEKRGKWKWKAPEAVTRMRAVVEAREVEVEEPPMPEMTLPPASHRGTATCGWKGEDEAGNIYKCANFVLRNPKTGAVADVCAFHTRHCVGHHPHGAERIAYPNHAALCVIHFVAAHKREPVSYAGELFVPGVALSKYANAGHPLVPREEPPDGALGERAKLPRALAIIAAKHAARMEAETAAAEADQLARTAAAAKEKSGDGSGKGRSRKDKDGKDKDKDKEKEKDGKDKGKGKSSSGDGGAGGDAGGKGGKGKEGKGIRVDNNPALAAALAATGVKVDTEAIVETFPSLLPRDRVRIETLPPESSVVATVGGALRSVGDVLSTAFRRRRAAVAKAFSKGGGAGAAAGGAGSGSRSVSPTATDTASRGRSGTGTLSGTRSGTASPRRTATGAASGGDGDGGGSGTAPAGSEEGGGGGGGSPTATRKTRTATGVVVTAAEEAPVGGSPAVTAGDTLALIPYGSGAAVDESRTGTGASAAAGGAGAAAPSAAGSLAIVPAAKSGAAESGSGSGWQLSLFRRRKPAAEAEAPPDFATSLLAYATATSPDGAADSARRRGKRTVTFGGLSTGTCDTALARAGGGPSQWDPKNPYDRKEYHDIELRRVYYKCAAKIQSVVRMAFARRAVARIRGDKLRAARVAAAMVIKRWLLLLAARRRFKARWLKDNASAQIIQRAFRMYRYRVALNADKEQRNAAAMIQRNWRLMRMAVSLRLLHVRAIATSVAAARTEAILKIRGLITRWRMRRMVREVLRMMKQKMTAAVVIQRNFRAYMAWKYGRVVIRPISPEGISRRIIAGRRILRWFRRVRVVDLARRERADAIRAVIHVQSLTRRFLARRFVQKLREQRAAARHYLAPGVNDRKLKALLDESAKFAAKKKPVAGPSYPVLVTPTGGRAGRALLGPPGASTIGSSVAGGAGAGAGAFGGAGAGAGVRGFPPAAAGSMVASTVLEVGPEGLSEFGSTYSAAVALTAAGAGGGGASGGRAGAAAAGSVMSAVTEADADDDDDDDDDEEAAARRRMRRQLLRMANEAKAKAVKPPRPKVGPAITGIIGIRASTMVPKHSDEDARADGDAAAGDGDGAADSPSGKATKRSPGGGAGSPGAALGPRGSAARSLSGGPSTATATSAALTAATSLTDRPPFKVGADPGGPLSGIAAGGPRANLSGKTSHAAAAAARGLDGSKVRVPVMLGRGAVLAGDEGREMDPDYQKIQAYVMAMEAAFIAEDKSRSGVVPRPTFSRILTTMGVKAAAPLMIKLQQTFMGPGDCVSYVSFIKFARGLRYICPLHRVLVCPVCITTGPCEGCRCKEFKLEAVPTSLAAKRARMCECGHHEARHVPSMRVHDETPVPLPDPLVLRMALHKASSIARSMPGGQSSTAGVDDNVSVQAFRSSLATDQAAVMEEVTSTLSVGASGMRGLEMAAAQRAAQKEIEDAAREVHERVLSPAERRAKALEETRRRATEKVTAKWNVLDDWLDDLDRHEYAASHGAGGAGGAGGGYGDRGRGGGYGGDATGYGGGYGGGAPNGYGDGLDGGYGGSGYASDGGRGSPGRGRQGGLRGSAAGRRGSAAGAGGGRRRVSFADAAGAGGSISPSGSRLSVPGMGMGGGSGALGGPGPSGRTDFTAPSGTFVSASGLSSGSGDADGAGGEAGILPTEAGEFIINGTTANQQARLEVLRAFAKKAEDELLPLAGTEYRPRPGTRAGSAGAGAAIAAAVAAAAAEGRATRSRSGRRSLSPPKTPAEIAAATLRALQASGAIDPEEAEAEAAAARDRAVAARVQAHLKELATGVHTAPASRTLSRRMLRYMEMMRRFLALPRDAFGQAIAPSAYRDGDAALRTKQRLARQAARKKRWGPLGELGHERDGGGPGGAGGPDGSDEALMMDAMAEADKEALARPEPDVIGDEVAMTDLIFHNLDFLHNHWREIVGDIRAGTVDGGPAAALTLDQRRQLSAVLRPDPGRASMVEAVLSAYFGLQVRDSGDLLPKGRRFDKWALPRDVRGSVQRWGKGGSVDLVARRAHDRAVGEGDYSPEALAEKARREAAAAKEAQRSGLSDTGVKPRAEYAAPASLKPKSESDFPARPLGVDPRNPYYATARDLALLQAIVPPARVRVPTPPPPAAAEKGAFSPLKITESATAKALEEAGRSPSPPGRGKLGKRHDPLLDDDGSGDDDAAAAAAAAGGGDVFADPRTGPMSPAALREARRVFKRATAPKSSSMLGRLTYETASYKAGLGPWRPPGVPPLGPDGKSSPSPPPLPKRKRGKSGGGTGGGGGGGSASEGEGSGAEGSGSSSAWDKSVDVSASGRGWSWKHKVDKVAALKVPRVPAAVAALLPPKDADALYGLGGIDHRPSGASLAVAFASRTAGVSDPAAAAALARAEGEAMDAAADDSIRSRRARERADLVRTRRMQREGERKRRAAEGLAYSELSDGGGSGGEGEGKGSGWSSGDGSDVDEDGPRAAAHRRALAAASKRGAAALGEDDYKGDATSGLLRVGGAGLARNPLAWRRAMANHVFRLDRLAEVKNAEAAGNGDGGGSDSGRPGTGHGVSGAGFGGGGAGPDGYGYGYGEGDGDSSAGYALDGSAVLASRSDVHGWPSMAGSSLAPGTGSFEGGVSLPQLHLAPAAAAAHLPRDMLLAAASQATAAPLPFNDLTLPPIRGAKGGRAAGGGAIGDTLSTVGGSGISTQGAAAGIYGRAGAGDAETGAADLGFLSGLGKPSPAVPEPFACPYPACGQRFTTEEGARLHVLRAHKDPPPLSTTTEADTFFKRLWRNVGLTALIGKGVKADQLKK